MPFVCSDNSRNLGLRALRGKAGNREAVELNSRGQRPRYERQKCVPTLKGSKNRLFEFDPFGVACEVDSDPVALPPATKFVRYANVKGLVGQKPGLSPDQDK